MGWVTLLQGGRITRHVITPAGRAALKNMVAGRGRVLPGKGDFADARHQHQLTAQLLGIAHQLRIGKTVARNGEEKAKHIAKVIVDERGDYARGEKAAGVTDPAT